MPLQSCSGSFFEAVLFDSCDKSPKKSESEKTDRYVELSRSKRPSSSVSRCMNGSITTAEAAKVTNIVPRGCTDGSAAVHVYNVQGS